MIKQEMALSKDFHGFVVGRPKIYSNTERPHVQLCPKSPSTWEWPSRPS
jgi:hypothetical protein